MSAAVDGVASDCGLLSLEGSVEMGDPRMNEGRFVMHAPWA